jgi:hypothetical protein
MPPDDLQFPVNHNPPERLWYLDNAGPVSDRFGFIAALPQTKPLPMVNFEHDPNELITQIQNECQAELSQSLKDLEELYYADRASLKEKFFHTVRERCLVEVPHCSVKVVKDQRAPNGLKLVIRTYNLTYPKEDSRENPNPT